MATESSLDQLTALFRALGAPDPRSWAESQLNEGIPQLARFLFLRQAWRGVVSDTDGSWIANWIAAAERDPSAPFAGGGLALRELRAQGASDRALTELARALQADLLFSLCYLLEDPGLEEPDVADLQWRLYEVAPDGAVLHPIASLHESVLGTDPTGRAMRPRK